MTTTHPERVPGGRAEQTKESSADRAGAGTEHRARGVLMHPTDCRCVKCLVDRSSFGTDEAKAARESVSDEQAVRVVACSKELDTIQAENNICTTDPHHFVWTWPVEGGRGSVGVCSLCGAVTTEDRDDVMRAEGLSVAEGLLRRVVDYWDGRPSEHHGRHIEADLRDVLRAITPISTTTETRESAGESES